MTTRKILVAEDDAALGPVLTALFEDAGYEVVFAARGDAAWDAFSAAHRKGAPPDVIVSDIRMPGLAGIELLQRIREVDPEVPVVFVTAFASLETAVEALRLGAFDYVAKPFQNEHLLHVVGNAVERGRLRAKNRTLRRSVQRVAGLAALQARSPGLEPVLRMVERVGPTEATVLVRGETGTGKELISRAIHEASGRNGGPFVAVSCAALPEALLESTLFGHVKGAFTGAHRAAAGLFRSASGGTLLLDEVAEMPLPLQAKLLRALEAREVRPVGADRPVPIDVRVVAATHRDLDDAVSTGRFREDLYYRLAVIEIEVPPLRERPGDIALLARHFLSGLGGEAGRPAPRLGPDAVSALRAYRWPGNVRELRNAMEHAFALGGDPVAARDLPPRVQRWARAEGRDARSHDQEDPPKAQPPEWGGPPACRARPSSAERTSSSGARTDDGPVTDPRTGDPFDLSTLERVQTERVLRSMAGDRKRAARALGIDLSTLYRRLKRWASGP